MQVIWGDSTCVGGIEDTDLGIIYEKGENLNCGVIKLQRVVRRHKTLLVYDCVS